MICETVLSHRLILVSIQKDAIKMRESGEESFHEYTHLNDLCFSERPNELSSSLIRKLKIDLDLPADMMGYRFQFLAIV